MGVVLLLTATACTSDAPEAAGTPSQEAMAPSPSSSASSAQTGQNAEDLASTAPMTISAPTPATSVALKDYIAATWRCETETGKEGRLFGIDTNLTWPIPSKSAFRSNGDIEKEVYGGYDRYGYWDYYDGSMVFGHGSADLDAQVTVPEIIDIPSSISVNISSTNGDTYDAETMVNFEADRMIMLTATYVNPEKKATTEGETVTCRK